MLSSNIVTSVYIYCSCLALFLCCIFFPLAGLLCGTIPREGQHAHGTGMVWIIIVVLLICLSGLCACSVNYFQDILVRNSFSLRVTSIHYLENQVQTLSFLTFSSQQEIFHVRKIVCLVSARAGSGVGENQHPRCLLVRCVSCGNNTSKYRKNVIVDLFRLHGRDLHYACS